MSLLPCLKRSAIPIFSCKEWAEKTPQQNTCPADNFKKYKKKHNPQNNVILKTQDMSQ